MHFIATANRNSSGKLKYLVLECIMLPIPFTNATLMQYNPNWLLLRSHETDKWIEMSAMLFSVE